MVKPIDSMAHITARHIFVLQLDSRDNVLIALTDLRQGETVEHNGDKFTLISSVPAKPYTTP